MWRADWFAPHGTPPAPQAPVVAPVTLPMTPRIDRPVPPVLPPPPPPEFPPMPPPQMPSNVEFAARDAPLPADWMVNALDGNIAAQLPGPSGFHIHHAAGAAAPSAGETVQLPPTTSSSSSSSFDSNRPPLRPGSYPVNVGHQSNQQVGPHPINQIADILAGRATVPRPPHGFPPSSCWGVGPNAIPVTPGSPQITPPRVMPSNHGFVLPLSPGSPLPTPIPGPLLLPPRPTQFWPPRRLDQWNPYRHLYDPDRLDSSLSGTPGDILGTAARQQCSVPEPEPPEGMVGSVAGECIICLERSATHLVVPCGHQCLCAICAQSLGLSAGGPVIGNHTCPACRGHVQQLVRVFVTSPKALDDNEGNERKTCSPASDSCSTSVGTAQNSSRGGTGAAKVDTQADDAKASSHASSIVAGTASNSSSSSGSTTTAVTRITTPMGHTNAGSSSSSSSSATADQGALKQLIEMGFCESAAQKVLRNTGGDLNLAVAMLVSDNDIVRSSTASSPHGMESGSRENAAKMPGTPESIASTSDSNADLPDPALSARQEDERNTAQDLDTWADYSLWSTYPGDEDSPQRKRRRTSSGFSEERTA
eukprot:gnl/MRDRNA2_/MRDRNA2_70336_c0_seq1.p1 gnl/MRDRNA2_/MRDRNA2_70336_c0~~gnl/MRDRNA2_/MRDRNA2_70336_c0_seq1.p1  ORF type:complete len:591 (-),score=103.68 gnl/MRDRNA2_/MRDRNA2_70336_c0_seq1:144-1916(-)